MLTVGEIEGAAGITYRNIYKDMHIHVVVIVRIKGRGWANVLAYACTDNLLQEPQSGVSQSGG